ncbi:hypothetical protein C7S16_5218 [Burkholderia thailandensis]|uniref:Uncharacterized protein n=1 Tax=Burkholderia thailandensis TaxID=57975 RepID=A0AAW9CJP3_BURTH|nr:hypothetical protein [Burkholderia thailandensis]
MLSPSFIAAMGRARGRAVCDRGRGPGVAAGSAIAPAAPSVGNQSTACARRWARRAGRRVAGHVS